MYLKCLLAFLMLGVTSVFAANHEIEKDFVVRGKPDVVSKWLLAHTDKIVESTNTKLVSRKDGLVRVRKNTSKGDYEFTMKESIKTTATTTVYTAKFVESHEGDLVGYTTKITLTPSSHGTKVVVYMFADINNKHVKPIDISVTLVKAARGLEKMLDSQF